MKLVLRIEGEECTYGLCPSDETDLTLFQISGLALDFVMNDI